MMRPMKYVLRGIPGGRLRRLQAFSVSCALHALTIAWLASLHSYGAEETRNLYNMMIRPEERRIVWFKPAEKLPAVSPASVRGDSRPRQVGRRFDETVV